MSTIITDIKQCLLLLEQENGMLRPDLQSLRRLVKNDIPGALNKCRFVAEKALHQLCVQNKVSWGNAEPTLERMIGPLTAKKIIPKNVSLHIRTLQTNASPGSHFQELSLSHAHVVLALIALLEFLRWYLNTATGLTFILSGTLDRPDPVLAAGFVATIPEPIPVESMLSHFHRGNGSDEPSSHREAASPKMSPASLQMTIADDDSDPHDV